MPEVERNPQDVLIEEFMNSLQRVEIDRNRQVALDACVDRALGEFLGNTGKRGGKLVLLRKNLRGLARAFYTSGFQDGFFCNRIEKGFVFMNGEDIPGFLAPDSKPLDGVKDADDAENAV